MRSARNTFKGAIYHAMNRGHNGTVIFESDHMKNLFTLLLREFRDRYRVAIYSYCIMTNHYHLIIENSSGLMPEFFHMLNGRFGHLYRKKYGGKGAVFQDRYKSLIINNDSYLLTSIAYTLNNPVRKGLCDSFEKYKWSSGKECFSENNKRVSAKGYIEEMFDNQESFKEFVNSMKDISTDDYEELNVREQSKLEINSENRKSAFNIEYKTAELKSADEVIRNFEMLNEIDIKRIDKSSLENKRLRAALLVELIDQTGLKYSEIQQMDTFNDLKVNSLSRIYRDAKVRQSNI